MNILRHCVLRSQEGIQGKFDKVSLQFLLTSRVFGWSFFQLYFVKIHISV